MRARCLLGVGVRGGPGTAIPPGQIGGVAVGSGKRDVGGVQSVSRALDILEIIDNDGGETTITDIAAQSGLPLPTIHRLLRTLVVRGYAHQTPQRRYALGWRLISLGETAGGSFGAFTKPLLRTVVDRLDESVSLSMRDMDGLMYVAYVPSERAMRMFTEVGRRVELHATGSGKTLLSMLPDEEVLGIVQRTGLTMKTRHTIVNTTRLLAELATIRERGFAVAQEEQEIGVVCVAVPIHGAINLALSISGPTPRMTPAAVAVAVPVLQSAARQLEAEFNRSP